MAGYEGLYEVSSLGRIRSLDRITVDLYKGTKRTRRIPGRVMTPYPVGKRRNGTRQYLAVRLCRDGVAEPAAMHILVADAFHGPRPDGLIVLHGNDDGHDNRAVNLRYGSYVENNADAVTNGGRRLSDSCKHGHCYVPASTRYPRQGGRDCLACRRASRRYRATDPQFREYADAYYRQLVAQGSG